MSGTIATLLCEWYHSNTVLDSKEFVNQLWQLVLFCCFTSPETGEDEQTLAHSAPRNYGTAYVNGELPQNLEPMILHWYWLTLCWYWLIPHWCQLTFRWYQLTSTDTNSPSTYIAWHPADTNWPPLILIDPPLILTDTDTLSTDTDWPSTVCMILFDTDTRELEDSSLEMSAMHKVSSMMFKCGP